MNDKKLHLILDLISIEWFLVGSRFTTMPPPSDTDADYLIIVKEGTLYNVLDNLEKHGFTDNSEEYGKELQFHAMRHGIYNLLVTEDIIFFRRFLAASAWCRHINMTDKEERIKFFKSVLYGER